MVLFAALVPCTYAASAPGRLEIEEGIRALESRRDSIAQAIQWTQTPKSSNPDPPFNGDPRTIQWRLPPFNGDSRQVPAPLSDQIPKIEEQIRVLRAKLRNLPTIPTITEGSSAHHEATSRLQSQPGQNSDRSLKVPRKAPHASLPTRDLTSQSLLLRKRKRSADSLQEKASAAADAKARKFFKVRMLDVAKGMKGCGSEMSKTISEWPHEGRSRIEYAVDLVMAAWRGTDMDAWRGEDSSTSHWQKYRTAQKLWDEVGHNWFCYRVYRFVNQYLIARVDSGI